MKLDDDDEISNNCVSTDASYQLNTVTNVTMSTATHTFTL